MNCVSTVTYSIMINGNPSPGFSPTQGLRQGDPLSPYLFLFIAESFSALICQAESAGSLHGARVCRKAPPISHLFCADDSLVIGKATQSELDTILDILNKYCRASGQRVSFDKSEILFSRGTPVEKSMILGARCGVKIVNKLGIYLGLPTSVGKSKRDIFQIIENRVHRKLKDWKSRCLSHAGKLTLIKAVAQSIPLYIMSCFLIPQYSINRLSRCVANFWWGQKGEENRIHWHSWDTLCKSKDFGGLGLRDFDCFNKALLAKQGWRLLNCPNSLFGRVLKARYFSRCTFLNAKTGYRPSYTWRSILQGQEILRKGLAWVVRNGHIVHIWDDYWVLDSPPPIFPRDEMLQNDHIVVRDLMMNDGVRWNSSLVNEIFT